MSDISQYEFRRDRRIRADRERISAKLDVITRYLSTIFDSTSLDSFEKIRVQSAMEKLLYVRDKMNSMF